MALENLLGLTSDVELAREGKRLTKLRAMELFESGLLDSLEVGTYAALAKIHGHLFQDVHGFAGRMRTANVAEGGLR